MLQNISREVFTVTQATQRTSRHGDETMWTLELTDVVNGSVFETYIVEEHKNFRHWQRIIENPDLFYFLGNLRLKTVKRGPNTGKEYIDGDSRVQIIHETADHTRFETLVYQLRGETLPPYLNSQMWETK
jgi:hypothetical protein